MKRNWIQILTLGLCAALLAVVIVQGQRIEEYRRYVEERIESLESSLGSEIRNISDNIQWELEEARQLVTDYTLEPMGIDAEKRALLAEFSLRLRQWYTDTQVRLLVTVGDEPVNVYLEPDGDGVFAAPMALPLEGDAVIQIEALISGGGMTTQESLGGWGDVSMLLPLHNGGGGWSGPEYRDGALHSNFSICIEGRDCEPAVVRQPEFLVYRNGELIQTLNAASHPYMSSEYTPGGDWSLECEPGDTVEIRFRCIDEWGLGYDFPFQIWTAEDGTTDNMNSAGAFMDSPALILFWPE